MFRDKSGKSDIKTLKKIISQIILDIDPENITMCQICFTSIKPNNLIMIPNCNHYYCKKCLDKCILNNIKERKIIMGCPNPKCSHKIDSQFIINRIKKHKNVKKMYETILLDNCIKESKDMSYCPNKKCSKVAFKNCYGNQSTCSYCNYKFCYICTKPYDDNHKCNSKDLLTYVNDDLKEMFIQNKMKICPGCKNTVIKNGGCNTMTCPSCKVSFCWLCLHKDEDFRQIKHKCKDYHGRYDEYDSDSSGSGSGTGSGSYSGSYSSSYSGSDSDSDDSDSY